MKKSKIRLLGMAVTLLCLLSVLVSAASVSFSDVAKTHWAYDEIAQMQQKGVIAGFPDGTFRPDSKVTTGQALKIIILAAGYDEQAPRTSHWASGYLSFSNESGWTVAKVDIPDLDVAITRELTAKIAAQAMGLDYASAKSEFSDTNSSYVAALSEIGIITGYPDGTFGPIRGLTRAELTVIASRIYAYRTVQEEQKQQEQEQEAEETEETEELVFTGTLRTSENGIAFIKKKEGFVKYAMWDYSQYSIGYGTYCEKNQFPNGITEAQADVLMRRYLDDIEDSLDAFEKKNGLSFTTTQYDALISLTYNIGTSWLSGCRLSRLLASGSYTHNQFASAYGIWCHVTTSSGKSEISSALITRRMDEMKLFLYGDYSGGGAKSFCYVKYTTAKGSASYDIGMYETGSKYGILASASNTGDTFLGWLTSDGTEVTGNSVVSDNLTLIASWQSDFEEEEEEEEEEPEDDDIPTPEDTE